MGSHDGGDGSEASNTVSMENLKKLESSLCSSLGKKIKQLCDLVEQLVKEKMASPPHPLEEPTTLPKVNASASPTVVVVGDDTDNTNPSTKKDNGKEEYHKVPSWYSPDPPIPHPHINNRGDPPKLVEHTFAQWKSLMKSHVHSSCIELWNIIEEGLKIVDPTNLTRR